jgi:hypothetical protein
VAPLHALPLNNSGRIISGPRLCVFHAAPVFPTQRVARTRAPFEYRVSSRLSVFVSSLRLGLSVPAGKEHFSEETRGLGLMAFSEWVDCVGSRRRILQPVGNNSPMWVYSSMR